MQAVAAAALPFAGRHAVPVVIAVIGFGLGFGVGTIAKPVLLADRYDTRRYATIAGLLTVRFTAEPSDAALVLDRRRRLIDAIRARYAGPTETRLIRVDDRTWVDMWRWDSPEILGAALAGAPELPEATAAFALAGEVSAEQGDVVAEDGRQR